jgi:hypothetical protein
VSLTSHVGSANSPIGRLMRAVFPSTRGLALATGRELRDIPTIPLASPDTAGLLGTAIDYRLRYYFGDVPLLLLNAGKGARIAIQQGLLTEESVAQIDARLTSTLTRLRPIGRRLGRRDEALLCQLCIVLALLEQCYRSPFGATLGPLSGRRTWTVDGISGLAKREWIDDLVSQSYLFFGTHEALMNETSIILNPTFDGSEDVGGADADIIVGKCLIDFKATIYPKVGREIAYQLLGYVLLDYSDQYKIDSVGVYFTRQGVLKRWPLQQFADGLSGTGRVRLDNVQSSLRSIVSRMREHEEMWRLASSQGLTLVVADLRTAFVKEQSALAFKLRSLPEALLRSIMDRRIEYWLQAGGKVLDRRAKTAEAGEPGMANDRARPPTSHIQGQLL